MAYSCKLPYDHNHVGPKNCYDIVKQSYYINNGLTFSSFRWLDADEDDGQVVREITASGVQLLASKSFYILGSESFLPT